MEFATGNEIFAVAMESGSYYIAKPAYGAIMTKNTARSMLRNWAFARKHCEIASLGNLTEESSAKTTD